ncbi:hypothetical protein [Synechococcus sp. RS9916]|uniref:hypothetical protein n=1 Tax=Synechococcus sp. RS9916 TaxID=221359 RepID=UPI0000E53918|nr:hypothetical protein [Synechococcus sp. RS9916]EAU75131.1 hypothetical protein RS9916_36527 [Synechococcus sp. RS9916]
MASFNKSAKSASLLCAAALMTASGLQTPTFAGNNNSAKNCENGRLIGTFAIQAQSNSKFVKKDDGKLRATKRSQPSSPSSKGVFELYSLKGMPGATDQTVALRSTRNPSKWWRVKRNNHSVKLESYQCRSDRTSTTFIGRGSYGAMALQARKNDQWIYVAGNGKLKAASDSVRNESVFKLVQIGQTADPDPQPPTPDPDPQPPTPDPDPQPVEPEVNLREDCLAFNPRALEVKDRGGRGGWTITQGSRQLLSFGDNKEQAHRSLDLIKAYGFNQSCFVGRPGPSMRYFKKGSSVPKYADSAVTPRDCININNRNLSLRDNGSYWSLTDGRSSLLSSDSKEEMAQAKAIIENYGLTKHCFVGRPNPPFAFWLR